MSTWTTIHIVSWMYLLDGNCLLRLRALPAGSNSSTFCAAPASRSVARKDDSSRSSTSFCASVDANRRHCAVHAVLNGRSVNRSRRMKALVTSCNAMAGAVMGELMETCQYARPELLRRDMRGYLSCRNTTGIKLAESRFYQSTGTFKRSIRVSFSAESEMQLGDIRGGFLAAGSPSIWCFGHRDSLEERTSTCAAQTLRDQNGPSPRAPN